MEQLHTNSTTPDDDHIQREKQLSDYVKRMETTENLGKLAKKLESDLKTPPPVKEQGISTPGVATLDVSTRDVSTPDLSFEKFEEKLKRESGQ